MQLVEKLIGDLLLRHNCVIVPTFGGFVAQRVGARYDQSSGMVFPPRKSVLFNRQLINNDGLLIAAIAAEMKTDFSLAQEELKQLVANWESQLKQGDRIAIDRVGFLYRDQEQNLCFEQDKFYNLLLESFGMSAVHFVSAEDAVAAESQQIIHKLTQDAPIVQLSGEIQPVVSESVDVPVFNLLEKRSSSGKWKYVAAAIALPLVFYSFWIPMRTDVLESGILSLSDFNPFHSQSNVEVNLNPVRVPQLDSNELQLKTLPESSTFSLQLDENTYVPVKISGESPAPHQPQPAEVPASGGYIIVGCFSSAENAARFSGELRSKGYTSSTLPAGNLTRVTAGSAAEFETLENKLRADGFEPWILK